MEKFLFNKSFRFAWPVFVLMIPALIIYGYFTKIFKCPSCYLFSDAGDGLKNYFTLAYYVQNDNGWHFSGMNYPYGENIIYTDNQPILALALRWIDRNLFDMAPHVTGTLNILLLISLYLAIIVTYMLLRRWGVGKLWAFGSALCIVLLSPQLVRLHGHYGLAYIVFLPLLFLLTDLLVRDSRKRWLWSIMACILVVIMSLSHMYFLLISLVVMSSFSLFWWWYHRREKEYLRHVLVWLGAVIVIPTLFLFTIKNITDKVQDRPVEPFGINYHNITFGSTFFPFIPPLDKVSSAILGIEKPIDEKIAYTGLIGLFMLPAILIFLFSKRNRDFMHLHVKAFLGAAVATWLMAAGVFYQNGLEFLWDLIPPLKQFRGLGRFGLPFYYLYTLVCSFLIWQVYFTLRERNLAKVGHYLLGCIFLFWSFESWLSIKSISEPVFRQNIYMADEKDNYIPLLESAGFRPGDFQAILQLPLVAIGNETIGVSRGFWTLREGFHASMETGLPLIDYSMSRTSVSQGLDIVELISTPYSPKRRALHFDERPILLVCEEEFVIPAERKWIDKAKKIGTYQSITLYSLPSEVFKTVELPIVPDPDSIRSCNSWFNGFEEYKCDTVMSGAGALVIENEPQSIWNYTDTSHVAREWIVSFWSYIDNVNSNLPVPRMMETDPNGTIVQNSGLHRETVLWAEAYGSWIETSFPLKTQGRGYRYELFIEQKGPVIDNLLIRAAMDTCIYYTPDMVLYNNLPVPLPK